MKRGALAGVAILAALSFGCDSDTRQADAQVQQIIHDSQTKRLGGEKSLGEAQQLLSKAVSNSAASTAMQIHAKAELAGVHLETGNSLQSRVEQNQHEMVRLLWEVNELAGQVSSGASVADGFRQFDPKPAREEIARKISQAQGSESRTAWFTHDNVEIPTLSAVKQEISRLDGEIAERQGKIAGLSEQRRATLDEADQTTTQSEAEKGQRAVELYKQGAEARKKAAELAVDVELLEAELVPLRHDLSVARGQEAALEQAVAQLQAQAKQIDEGWDKIRQQIEAQKSAAKATVGDPTIASGPEQADAFTAGGSISQKVARVAALAAVTQELRLGAIENLEKAATSFKEAMTAAESLRRELKPVIDEAQAKGSASAEPHKAMLDVYHPTVYRLQQAMAQQRLGNLHASHAALLFERRRTASRLSNALDNAGLRTPEGLVDSQTEDQLKAAREAAVAAYQAANEELINVSESASEDRKNVARASRVLMLYAWANALRDAGEDGSAQERLAEAREVGNELKVPYPAMPPEVAPPPPIEAIPTPVEEPATQPAPESGEGAAPAGEAPAGAAPAGAAPSGEPAPGEAPPLTAPAPPAPDMPAPPVP